MDDLWRRIGTWKSRSKSAPDISATQNKPQESKLSRNELVLLGKPAKRFNLADVNRASKQKLGKAPLERTYKAELEDGITTVVVKMLGDVVLRAKEFRDKVKTIRTMDHENLLPLRGYFYSEDQKFLLYDYMPLGSLSDQLQGRVTPLSWEVRLSIALGAARAIEHLHAQNGHHGNFKSSKVLLTPSYEARVSDYGLTLFPTRAGGNGANQARAGWAQGRKADVRAFGVLLLDLLEVTPPSETLYNGRADFLTSVHSVFLEMGVAGVFGRRYHDLDEKLLKLAIDCASVAFNSRNGPRTPMLEVRRRIEELCKLGVIIGTKDMSSWFIPGAQVDRDSQLYQFCKVDNDMRTRKLPNDSTTSENLLSQDANTRIGDRKSSSQSSLDRNVTQNKLVLLGNPAKRFNLADVNRASKQNLGKARLERTYKAELEDGITTVVVKMLRDVVLRAMRFRDKVETIGTMDHKNLLPLRGYFYSKDQKFLLYDYMPLGSLSDQLQNREPPLSWEVRLSIALGAARAIEHLHAQNSHHGNFKSSKVLLTPSYEARVSDYGLTLFPTRAGGDGANRARAGGAKKKGADVHAFGVLLLELLEVMPPSDTLYNGRADFLTSVYTEVEKLLKLAIDCASDGVNSRDGPRTPMSEVRRRIEELCKLGGRRDWESQPDKVIKGTKDIPSWLIPNAQVDRDSQLYQFRKVKKDMHTRKPPDGVLEVSDRVYGESTQFHGCKEGMAAVTATNFEITCGWECASSSAVSSDSIEATKELVHNSAQIPEMTMLQEEKSCQLDGVISSTSMSSGSHYDVFLSFRGPDTRSGITDFLYTSLLAAGIHTYRDDDELKIGEEIGPELLKGINHSKISIPILSKGYAFSKWCLSELVQMVECSKSRGQKIMPIFYDVTPSEVRNQTGSYGDAFVSHEKQFDNKAISKWKAALKEVGSLKGWDINSMTTRREGELVNQIVQKVIAELKRARVLVTDCLVGVEHHVKEINRMVCGDLKDSRILGIHGTGGVGKTTLAKIIYNQLLHQFEGCCFLSNVRETSHLKGIECLQNQLISDILKKKWPNISNAEEGIKIIKERLRDKKVMVLLDDVDQMNHWDALIGKPIWFGLGSRIIITSRNRDIVNVPEVCYPYELMSMNFNHSLQLFCKHAFERDYPLDDYVAFSTEVVKSTGGLPLALEAVGKLLLCRSKDVWDVILRKLKQVPLKEVKEKLKISYDALDDCQKHIFLEIACLYTGFDQRIMLHSWKESNLFPEEGLEVLQRMSLIKIGEDNKLWMHDQLKGLGRDIVRRECNEEWKKKTRLWNHAEGLDVAIEPKGTLKIEALGRKFDPQLLYNFANEEVERLCNLRYPEVRVFQENWPLNDGTYGDSTCLLLHKIGICVCQLGKQFFLPSLQY